METLLRVHSFMLWIIAASAMLTLSKLAWDWRRGHSFTRIHRMMSASFTGLLDLQALFGIALLLGSWSNTQHPSPDRIYHTIIMITAVSVAHMAGRWKHASDTIRLRNTLGTHFLAVLLISIGISL